METLSEMIRAYLNGMQVFFLEHFIKGEFFSHFLLYHILTTNIIEMNREIVWYYYIKVQDFEYLNAWKKDQKPYRVYPMGLILIQSFNFRFWS